MCECVCVYSGCVDTAHCQRRFEASSVTVRAEASWAVGRLCLSALFDPVIHQAQSREQGTDQHLLQQVKNIEMTGKDLQLHERAHTFTYTRMCVCVCVWLANSSSPDVGL